MKKGVINDKRIVQDCELRMVRGENGTPTRVTFTPIITGVRSNNYGFNEIIERTAFDEADMTDIRALFNHNPDLVMGRTTNNTLRWSWDGDKIRAEVDLPENFPAYQLELMERGDVTGASFGFVVNMGDDKEYEWKREKDGILGTLKRAKKVYDFSVVTFPFFDATEGSVGLRSAFEEFAANAEIVDNAVEESPSEPTEEPVEEPAKTRKLRIRE